MISREEKKKKKKGANSSTESYEAPRAQYSSRSIDEIIAFKMLPVVRSDNDENRIESR